MRLKPRNGVRFVTDDSDPCSCEFAAVSQLAKLRHLRILGEYAYIFILNPGMACVSEYGRADAIVKVVTKPKRHSQIVVSSLTVREEVYPYFAATDAVLDLTIKASLFFV